MLLSDIIHCCLVKIIAHVKVLRHMHVKVMFFMYVLVKVLLNLIPHDNSRIEILLLLGGALF
jgi:hypothetical protein